MTLNLDKVKVKFIEITQELSDFEVDELLIYLENYRKGLIKVKERVKGSERDEEREKVDRV